MAERKLKLVIDTNVFLVSLAEHYHYHWLYRCLLQNKFDFYITTEILLEYQEQICLRYGLLKTDVILDFLLLLPNVFLITPYFNWNIIEKDKEDNKFVDYAVTANADFIITNDNDFKILDTLEFPPVKRIKIEDFSEQYKMLLIEASQE